jgi:hypothetical protein
MQDIVLLGIAYKNFQGRVHGPVIVLFSQACSSKMMTNRTLEEFFEEFYTNVIEGIYSV